MPLREPTAIIIDNFLSDPDGVRQIGLTQDYSESPWYKGRRSAKTFPQIVTPADIEPFLPGKKIIGWEGRHPMNARFQYCTPADPLVFHTDLQRWAGALYLTPAAPLQSGTTLYRHRATHERFAPKDAYQCSRVFNSRSLFDKTMWEPIDQIGNVYNRLVLWDGRHAHAASEYFGENVNDARLFMIFFFDTDDMKETPQ